MLVSAGRSSAQEAGLASYYHDYFTGKRTASGENYDPNKLTAAHKSLPIGTLIKVTNLDNGKSVIVIINDRGPFVPGRIIDLDKVAFQKIASICAGVITVKMEEIAN